MKIKKALMGQLTPLNTLYTIQKDCESKHHILGGLPRFLCITTESCLEVGCGPR